MLTYQETIWKKENGFKIIKDQLDIGSIQTSETVKDQSAWIGKLSLVVFLIKKTKENSEILKEKKECKTCSEF